ncbi:MAG: hypothetical protein JNM99_16865 [Verrucomicrobiaceae bacterium]|nr:hypothetical protein [Verrucomicrobiaceae bacterium]
MKPTESKVIKGNLTWIHGPGCLPRPPLVSRLSDSDADILHAAFLPLTGKVPVSAEDRQLFLNPQCRPALAVGLWVKLALQHCGPKPTIKSQARSLIHEPSKPFLDAFMIFIRHWARNTQRKHCSNPGWQWDAFKGIARSLGADGKHLATEWKAFVGAVISGFSKQQPPQTPLRKAWLKYCCERGLTTVGRDRRALDEKVPEPPVFPIIRRLMSDGPALSVSEVPGVEKFIPQEARVPGIPFTVPIAGNARDAHDQAVARNYHHHLLLEVNAGRSTMRQLIPKVVEFEAFLEEVGEPESIADARQRLWIASSTASFECQVVMHKRIASALRQRRRRARGGAESGIRAASSRQSKGTGA